MRDGTLVLNQTLLFFNCRVPILFTVTFVIDDATTNFDDVHHKSMMSQQILSQKKWPTLAKIGGEMTKSFAFVVLLRN